MAPYDRKLALAEPLFARSQQIVENALRGETFRTRDELGTLLGAAGIDARGPRLAHLMMRAELDAVVCSGPRRGHRFTYALLDERAPAPSRERADLSRGRRLGELALRYFAAHGPAQTSDFAWWAGLTLSDARAGMEAAGARLVETTFNGKSFFRDALGDVGRGSPAAALSSSVCLLASYDEYLIGYKDHAPILDATHAAKLGRRESYFAKPLIVLDGRVVGTWRRGAATRNAIIHAELVTPLTSPQTRKLATAIARYGQFVDCAFRLDMTIRAG